MARLVFPDEGSRLVYQITAGTLRAVAAGTVVQLWADEAGTVLPDVQAYPGYETSLQVGAQLLVDGYSRLPLWYGPDGVDTLWVQVSGGPVTPVYARADDRIDQALPKAGGVVSGRLVIDRHGAPSGYPIGQAGAVESLSVLSSFAGGEDDGLPGQFDSTGRINLYSYQRADVASYGETIRHFAMRKDSKQMEAWYFPSGGYDVNRNPVGTFKPVVWAGAHWEANNHASNHKHWSVETPDSDGSIETRFEVRWGDPSIDNAIAGLDKTLIATNLADFVVRCTNGQEMRLTSPNGEEKKLVFSRDPEGDPAFRRWVIRSTNESETGANAGSNFQIGRYDDTGTLQDTPIVISRSTGNVTLGPGVVARRSTSTVSSLSLNTTSLGGGVGVLAIGNANTVPASNPTAGIVLYVLNGRLKIRQPDGTDQFVALTAT